MASIHELTRSCESKSVDVGPGIQGGRREIPELDTTKGDASDFEQSWDKKNDGGFRRRPGRECRG